MERQRAFLFRRELSSVELIRMSDQQKNSSDCPDGENPTEDRLDELVAEYVDRLTVGEIVDKQQILRDHPDLGTDLLERLEVFHTISPSIGDEPLGALGDYTLRRQIGRGGMGVVYDAWQNSVDRQVALKVLLAGVAADERALQRFVREAKTAAQLNHQNIVHVHGMGVEENTPYYSMEYVEGETVAQVLAKIKEAGDETDTPFGPKNRQDFFIRLAAAFADVAEGLQHAHSRRIIHRDIKPSNLILDGEGRLRILDFGLARLESQESLTVSGDFVGTPLYMSPEQARARKIPVDHRTDVYSLGATLYEMLTCQPPFKGRDCQDTLSQIIERDPPPLRKRNARIPRDLETIVLKCLLKEPAVRYGTAEALAQDLRRFVRGDPIEARPQSPWARLARRAWRVKGRIGIACLGVLLIGTSGLLIYKNARERAARRADQAQEALDAKRSRYREIVIGAAVRLEVGRLEYGELGLEQRNEVSPRLLAGIWKLDHAGAIGDPVREAVESLEKAIQLLPGEPEAFYQLARARLVLGQHAAARTALAQALHSDPEFVPALMLQDLLVAVHEGGEAAGTRSSHDGTARHAPWASAWVRAYRAMAAGQWKEAARAYGELIAFERAGPQPYLSFSMNVRLGRGCARFNAGDLDGALTDFEIAHWLWPSLAEAVLLVGKTYFAKGDPARAEARFRDFYDQILNRDTFALQVAELYHGLGDYRQSLRWAERASESVRREAQRSDYLGHLGHTAKAIEAAQRAIELDPESLLGYGSLGIAYVREGRAEDARAAYVRALACDPDSAWIHANLGLLYRWQGKHVQAFSEFRRALGLGGQWLRLYFVLRDLLQRSPRLDLGGEVRLLAETLERIIASKPGSSTRVLRMLVLALTHDSSGMPPDKAVRYAQRAVESSNAQDPELLAALAELQFRGGWREAAVRSLERTVVLPGSRKAHARTLDEYRRDLLPDLVTYASIDAAIRSLKTGNSNPDRETDRRHFASFIALAEEKGARQRLAYLQGRLLQRLGNHAEAVKQFQEAAAVEKKEPEPLVRLAESFRVMGEPEKAAVHLREALQTGAAHAEGDWHYWHTLSSTNMKLSVAEVLASLPTRTGGDEQSSVHDLRWAFASLSETGAIRINCGGGEYRSSSGVPWGADRYFCDGYRYYGDGVGLAKGPCTHDITRTEDDPLYQTERWFPKRSPSDEADWSGYRIPVVPGRYRVTLHFAEIILSKPGERVFGVSLEGERRLEAYEPISAGFLAADQKTFDVSVDDMVFDIEFHRQVENPKISAIEIEALN